MRNPIKLHRPKPPHHTSHDVSQFSDELVLASGRLFSPGVVRGFNCNHVKKKDLWLRHIEAEWPFDKVDWYRFNGCAVNASNGLVYHQASRQFFVDFHWGWGKPRSFKKPRFKPRKLKELKGDGNPLYLISGGGYHGIVEDIPTALKLKNEFPDLRIATTRYNDWVMKLLVNMGIPEKDFSPVQAGSWIASDELVVATKSSFGEFVNADALIYLNQYSRKQRVSRGGSGRIYISREKADARAFEREYKLREIFQNYGFLSVTLEDLSVYQQVDLFSSASVIAGFHGAGLVNQVFSSSGVDIIELYHSGKINPCYASMAVVLGHRYRNFEVAHDLSNIAPLKVVLENLPRLT